MFFVSDEKEYFSERKSFSGFYWFGASKKKKKIVKKFLIIFSFSKIAWEKYFLVKRARGRILKLTGREKIIF